SNKTSITAATTDINANKTSISSNKTAIASNSSKLATHEATIKTATTERHANTASIASNTTSITSNRTAIADNSHAIGTNSANIASNKLEIDGLRADLEKQSKKMDGSMAQAGAFAGLVNPYGVGKINMTAAVGHSGDANAIAIGSGYRVNENLTLKVGGAYDSASEQVTSYAGMGFEW
ncbi:YadA-like family protein, partial [Vibrio rarus]